MLRANEIMFCPLEKSLPVVAHMKSEMQIYILQHGNGRDTISIYKLHPKKRYNHDTKNYFGEVKSSQPSSLIRIKG